MIFYTKEKPMYCKNTCDLFKNARLISGLTQLQLAVQLDYESAQFVSNWERYQSAPPDAKLKKLRKILRVGQHAIYTARIEDRRAELMEVL